MLSKMCAFERIAYHGVRNQLQQRYRRTYTQRGMAWAACMQFHRLRHRRNHSSTRRQRGRGGGGASEQGKEEGRVLRVPRELRRQGSIKNQQGLMRQRKLSFEHCVTGCFVKAIG